MHHHHHPYDPAIAERKQRNRDIFAETMRICQAGGYVAPSGAAVRLPATGDVLKASVFYQNPPRVDDVPSAGTTVCDAVNEDCIETTRKLVADGYRPIMLNMANRHTPGGGVINGARAQEESLFRQSNLCVSLYQFDEYHASLLGLPLGNGRYPMDRNTGGIYSGRVTFFRTSSRNGDTLVETPFECAVVSVAAINRPDLTSDGRLVDWAARATKSKIRTMLRIGLLHGHDAIVLGAWGCGAFCNPPEHMAQLFHEVLRETEFADKYRVVRFAVIEDHNSRHSNFAPFDREFNRKAKMDTRMEPQSPREIVEAMKRLATEMHTRDTPTRRITHAPYITHPARVVAMLESWGYSADDMSDALILATGWGHDLLEDTKVSEEEILKAAGAQGQRILWRIKELTFTPGKVDDEEYDRLKIIYVQHVADSIPEVVVVKMADRLCNSLDFCAAGNPWGAEYLKLAAPVFARMDECKGADRIRATLDAVRRRAAEIRDPHFPKELAAEMLADFKTTPRGCTHPRVGEIDGHRFIAKCGSWSAYSSDEHVHNEFVADNLLRAAGLNVPFSREYSVDFGDGRGRQTVRLAVYDDALKPIMEVWDGANAALRAKIRAQVVAAYPVQALIAGIDTFTWDNVKVDPEGRIWFVDNGASFDFRACGKRKGWFWQRHDVADPRSGYLSLAKHPDQYDLHRILGTVNDAELWTAAKDCRFTQLVAQLPDAHRRPELMAYAKALEVAAAKI